MKKLLLLFSVVMAAFAVNAQTYYMAGNGTADNNWCCGENWNVAGCAMTGSGSNWTYETTVPAGTYEFKITNGKWYDPEKTPDGINYGYNNVDGDASTPGYEGPDNIKFTVASEATITVNLTIIDGGGKIVLKSNVPFGEVVITSWTIVGPSWLMGSDWDTKDTSNDMTNTSGSTWTLVKSGVPFDPSDVENGTISFKAVANHSYSVGEIPGPGSDASMTAPTEAGTYDFTFELDASLQSVMGTFAKSTGSAVDETSAAVVTAANGTVYADGELVIYDLVGNNVTAENGNLKGVYVVVVDGVSSKINVQ